MLPPTGECEYRDHKKGLGSVRRKEDLQVTPTGSVQSVHGSQEEDLLHPKCQGRSVEARGHKCHAHMYFSQAHVFKISQWSLMVYVQKTVSLNNLPRVLGHRVS